MKSIGRVEVPQDAFIAAITSDSGDQGGKSDRRR